MSESNEPESTSLVPATHKAPVMTGERGLQFQDMESLWRFCVAVSNSRAFKDVDTPENALVRIQAGLELGLSPIWSLCNVMFFNGRPAVWGDALMGLVQGHKDCEDVIEPPVEGSGDQMEATCTVKRKNRLPVKRTFSVADAKKAGLWDKAGPWKTYPKRMLQMRARSWACRDSFADALRGIGVIEELRDVPAVQAREIEKPKLILPEDENQAAEVEPEVPGFVKCDYFHEGDPCGDPNCWMLKEKAEPRPVKPEKIVKEYVLHE